MKKKAVAACVLLFIIMSLSSCQINNDNNSDINIEWTTAVLSELEEEYGHVFSLDTKEFEENIYGTWQAKDGLFGYDNSVRYHSEAFLGKIITFDEDILIYNGTPWHRPTYAYYLTSVENMATDPFLRLTCLDDTYAKSDGAVITALNAASSENNMPYASNMRIKLIIIDDMLIIESDSTYYKLTKIGDINMY